ncbi:predicted membrane protein [Haemophilus influenzae 22.1-21]|nr:predicted membrane protein [Haemophilus influenzae 22.1-21]
MHNENLKELTVRGIILGALITVIFTASNVYLGLKVGVTFASSIPAAVISMAVLKFFKDSSILEIIWCKLKHLQQVRFLR